MKLTEEKMIKIAKQSLGLTITDSFDTSCDLYCYNESTVDGYDVWVLTHSLNDVNVSENVYYYDGDLASAVMEEIQYNGGSETLLHMDEYLWDDLYMDDQMLEYFAETVDDIIESNNEEGYGLTPAEIQELIEEHGLEAEEIEETVS
tara:strand:- start:125 stop:565 length:441 start_codon:yes stop_codon:yes gene_type:complete